MRTSSIVSARTALWALYVELRRPLLPDFGCAVSWRNAVGLRPGIGLADSAYLATPARA